MYSQAREMQKKPKSVEQKKKNGKHDGAREVRFDNELIDFSTIIASSTARNKQRQTGMGMGVKVSKLDHIYDQNSWWTKFMGCNNSIKGGVVLAAALISITAVCSAFTSVPLYLAWVTVICACILHTSAMRVWATSFLQATYSVMLFVSLALLLSAYRLQSVCSWDGCEVTSDGKLRCRSGAGTCTIANERVVTSVFSGSHWVNQGVFVYLYATTAMLLLFSMPFACRMILNQNAAYDISQFVKADTGRIDRHEHTLENKRARMASELADAHRLVQSAYHSLWPTENDTTVKSWNRSAGKKKKI